MTLSEVSEPKYFWFVSSALPRPTNVFHGSDR